MSEQSNGTAAAPVVSSGTGGQPAAAAGQQGKSSALWDEGKQIKSSALSESSYFGADRAVESGDFGHRQEAISTLRAEWGEEYSSNLALLNGFLDTLPAKQRTSIEEMVLPNGRRALNDPEALRELLSKARGGPVPQDHVALNREIKAIESYMRENRSAYNKDVSAQARLRDLYTARDGE